MTAQLKCDPGAGTGCKFVGNTVHKLARSFFRDTKMVHGAGTEAFGLPEPSELK